MRLVLSAVLAALVSLPLLPQGAAADWQPVDCKTLPFKLDPDRIALPTAPICFRMFLEDDRDILVVEIAEAESQDFFLHVSRSSLGTKKELPSLSGERLIGLAGDLRPQMPQSAWSRPTRVADGLATFAAAKGETCFGYQGMDSTRRARRVVVKCGPGSIPPGPEDVERLLSAITFP